MSCVNHSTLRRIVPEMPDCFVRQEGGRAVFMKTPNSVGKIAEGGIRLQGKYKADAEGQPLVSVITAVYNGAEFLEDTINSVLGQKYSNVEYIVIDGGSTDATLSIIRKYEHAIDYWVSEPDGGVYAAMNKGISLASGSWIGLINSDDRYTKDAIEIVAGVAKSGAADIVCGDLDIVSRQEGAFIARRSANYLKLPFGMYVNHPASFVRSAVYRSVASYDSSLRIAADYKFFLTAFVLKVRFCNVSACLAVMRDGGLSIKHEQLTKQEERSVRKEVLPYALYLLVVLIKKIRRRG